MKSPVVTGDHNGDHTDYCFNRYLPILKKVSDQYETDYKRCVEARELECLAIDALYADPRHNITETARGTCLRLQNCSSHKNTAESFECFAGTVSRTQIYFRISDLIRITLKASKESKTLYNLSADAGLYALEIRELYRVAETVEEACCSRAERVYWDDTSSTYVELSECLAGDIKPELDDPITEEPSTDAF